MSCMLVVHTIPCVPFLPCIPSDIVHIDVRYFHPYFPPTYIRLHYLPVSPSLYSLLFL